MRFDGKIYDCGAKLGFLTANVAYALERHDIGPELRREIEALLQGLSSVASGFSAPASSRGS